MTATKEDYIEYAKIYLDELCIPIDLGACEIFSVAQHGWSKERKAGASFALQKYGIARNCGKKPEEKKEENRFAPLFRVIDEGPNLNDCIKDPVKAVADVREGIRDFYGKPHSKAFFVAASKILWFRFHQSSIVICDSLTMKALGLKGNRCNYENFYPLWDERFKEDEAAISEACDELTKARPKCEHRDKISKLWFRKRVLDKCLMVEGAKIKAEEEARKEAKKKAKKKA